MNRTNEFLYIVNSTHIPQHKLHLPIHINTYQLTKHALDTLYTSDLDTNVFYTKLRKLEKELNSHQINMEYVNLQEEKVYNSIEEYRKYMDRMVKLQWQRCYDKLVEMKRVQNMQREKYIHCPELQTENYNNRITQNNKTQTFLHKKYDYVTEQSTQEQNIEQNNTEQNNTQQSLLIQETESVKKRDIICDQIEDQITELGQIMCDISMHIQAQGECLKRLDDMVVESDDYLKRSVYEIQRMWCMVGGRRNAMGKFFSVFILILFIIYCWKRFI